MVVAMITQLQSPPMSPQEYLEWEAQQPEKYGYINGQVYAMAGGTVAHSEIASNLIALLKPHLRGSGCRTLGSDAKINIAEGTFFHYADVSVTCDEQDRTATKFISHPCLIVEVLSSTTEAFDRGDKFQDYRRIETLQEYVLIHAKRMSVECHRLNESGVWETYYYNTNLEDAQFPLVELASVSLSFPIDELYENINLNAADSTL